jgi:predicted SprT family Zn-dependent metalloprotease
MRDTFGKKEYTCKCGTVTEGYVWVSQIKDTQFECTKCGKWLGYGELSQKKVTSIISIRTPTKNR